MSSAAQDEFQALINNNDRAHSPDRNPPSPSASDLDQDSDSDSSRGNSEEKGSSGLKSARGLDHSSAFSSDNTRKMPSISTHIPRTVYDANTGPKGVIADAQAFERARKTSLRKTLLSAPGFGYPQQSLQSQSQIQILPSQPRRRGDEYIGGNGNRQDGSHDEEGDKYKYNDGDYNDDDDDDDNGGDNEFLHRWRMARMLELQNSTEGNKSKKNGGGGDPRRPSPCRRMYGTVEDVDAEGYLDAIERVTYDTVVVVCIYDPESGSSAIVEDALDTLAERHPLTRFVKLHHEIAEMDHICAPALLAYRGAEVFATLIDLLSSVPNGQSFSAQTLDDLLHAHRVL